MADPDLKDIPKQAVDMLRSAAQLFAEDLFQKCVEGAKEKKRVTANMRDFEDVVRGDAVLSAMLGQFFVDAEEEDEGDAEEE